MRTPTVATLALAAALAALAGCGDTLVDHTNTDIQNSATGATCGPNLVECGDPATPVCRSQNVNDPNGYVCGTSCQPCGAPPTDATVTCTPIGDGGHDGVCGFDCAPGFLKTTTPDACVAPALVAAGGQFSCATAAGTGEVHCWGGNDKGQLGPGVTGTSRATSAKVEFAALVNVTALAAGPAHACAAAGGTVYCWGDATGFGGVASSATPVAVPALAGSTKLAAGANHTCGIVGDAVKCAGLGTNGGGTPAITGTVSEIAAGDGFTCALVAGGAGAIRCWGADDHGQSSGSGSVGTTVADTAPSTIAFPPSAAGLTLTHVAAGATHACAGTNENGRNQLSVFCWGDNRSNQLGVNATGTIGAPTNLKLNKELSANPNIPILEGGGVTTCAVKLDPGDILTCWSGDDIARGGVAPAGETADLTSATPPGRFSVGAGHACIVNPAGKLACWGHNDQGQLGDGTNTTPTAGTFVLVVDR